MQPPSALGSRPRVGPIAILTAELAVVVLATTHLWTAKALAGPLALLLVGVPLAATLAALSLSRGRATRGFGLLPIGLALNLLGLLILSQVASAFAFQQSLWSLVSLAAYFGVVYFAGEVAWLEGWYTPLFLLSSLLVLLTFFVGINPSGDAHRQWMALGPFYFQPSELLKLSLALLLAQQLARGRADGPHAWWRLGAIGVSLGLLMLQGDLGAAFMVAALGTVIVFAHSGRWRRLLLGAAIVAIAGAVAYWQLPYVRFRFDTWLHPWIDPTGTSYQVVQAQRALAEGGLWGKGLVAAETTHVPASHTDSIIAAIGERLGLLGSAGVLSLYGLLLAQMHRRYRSAATPVQALLITGLAALLIGQALLIVAGATGLVPLTGVTLPFVSYGGSSLLISYLALAILDVREPARSRPAEPGDRRGHDVVYRGLAVGLVLLLVWLAAWHLAGTEIIRRLAP